MRSALICILLLAATGAAFAKGSTINGVVRDSAGLTVLGARISILGADGRVLGETRTGANGSFVFESDEPGRYIVRVEAPGFQIQQIAVDTTVPQPEPVRVHLELAGVTSAITVTTTRGSVEDVETASHVVSVADRDSFTRVPLPTLASSLKQEPGIFIQETTYGQASPFLRGLTGYQTLILFDMVRYNTSMFRSGPNQFLAFIDPSQVDRFEATLGPSSAAYGSDSLGGTLHMLTQPPSYGMGKALSVHGNAAIFAGSADASGTGRGAISLSNEKFWWLVGGSGRRLNNLRAGQGTDSHNVFRRYFGLTTSESQDLLGERMRDTGFSAGSFHTKLALRWGGEQSQSLTGWFHRTELSGQRSYRDLLGGLGRLRSDLDPQRGQLGYVRYEKTNLGMVDSLIGIFSYNSQLDGAVRQATRLTDVVVREDNRVRVFGYTLQATTHAGGRHSQLFGGEIYQEKVTSNRFETNPVTLAQIQTRALFPNDTHYRTSALFFQNMTEVIPGRLRGQAGVRFTSIRFQTFADQNLNAAGASLGVADSTQVFRDLTFNTSASYQLQKNIKLHVLIGRGFRAPNVSDLGRVGLNGGLGYEVSNEDAIRSNAFMGSNSGEGALWTGRPVSNLKPETLFSYEAGVTFQLSNMQARMQGFDAEFSNPITGRTLLFPSDKVPSTVAGLPVVALSSTAAQRAQGVVTVAPVGIDPRSLKSVVNDGKSKYYGLEMTLSYTVSSRWGLRGTYSWMNGRDLNPNRPARRLIPQQGSVSLRYSPSGRRPWLNWTAGFAGPQTRMNPGDIDDERIGASRSRTDITNFFNSAIVQPYLVSDNGVMRFKPTGESIDQIRDRVLPIGAVVNGVTIADNSTRVPLYANTPGWIALDVTGGFPIREKTNFNFGLMNLLDRNYRVHGSGIDSSGRNAFVGIEWKF